MNPNEKFVIAVYDRADADRVRPAVQELERCGVHVWLESEELRPGSNWNNSIGDAIRRASGALVFVSTHMAASEWVRYEIMAFHSLEKPIYPVYLDDVGALPLSVLWVLETLPRTRLDDGGMQDLARKITSAWDENPPAEVTPTDHHAEEYAREVAKALAAQARRRPPASGEPASAPTSVFIAHGHDDALLDEVSGHIASLGVEPVVLRRIGGPAQSLFKKFWDLGSETRFALVLLSADDYGASREQFEAEGVGERALKFRARQNVILELGFFYGLLGWERVFVLFKDPDRVFPDFELPSDLHGVVYDRVDPAGRWKATLEKSLRDAGFVLKSPVNDQH